MSQGRITKNELSQELLEYLGSSEDIRSLRLNQLALALELETIKRATLSNVDSNIFIESFINLNDIELTGGKFDSTNQKIYLA